LQKEYGLCEREAEEKIFVPRSMGKKKKKEKER
jgi:hypothetical protein